ncbi:unnamed protein product [Absidia cylindrospora]
MKSNLLLVMDPSLSCLYTNATFKIGANNLWALSTSFTCGRTVMACPYHETESKCKLIPPTWLTAEHLKAKLEQEENKDEFCNLPFYYMETAHMILESASDDIPNVDQVRKLLKDLRETRQSKARVGLTALDNRWLGMHNLSFMEINEIRPFFSRVFDEMRKLDYHTNDPTDT